MKKPITQERLTAALDKVRGRIMNDQTAHKLLGEGSQVFVKDGEKCWFVPLREVRVFEIWDNYTRIYCEDQMPMIPKTLNYMETRLDPETFFRANRQQIVNLKWIEKIEPWFSGTIRIYLKDGT
ncbi:MAG: LytTR family DNA-binding domain-containing protein, partial [Cyclobacteriaceae bacterium]